MKHLKSFQNLNESIWTSRIPELLKNCKSITEEEYQKMFENQTYFDPNHIQTIKRLLKPTNFEFKVERDTIRETQFGETKKLNRITLSCSMAKNQEGPIFKWGSVLIIREYYDDWYTLCYWTSVEDSIMRIKCDGWDSLLAFLDKLGVINLDI